MSFVSKKVSERTRAGVGLSLTVPFVCFVSHHSAACGVDHDLSLEGCDLYWKKTLQKGHIESLDLPTVGMGDKKLETVEEIIDYLEEAIQSDTRLKLGTHMSMGYYAYMLPLPNNAKSVIQRDGYYTPDGRFVAYRVQGVGEFLLVLVESHIITKHS